MSESMLQVVMFLLILLLLGDDEKLNNSSLNEVLSKIKNPIRFIIVYFN
jgi:hypothetical protein